MICCFIAISSVSLVNKILILYVIPCKVSCDFSKIITLYTHVHIYSIICMTNKSVMTFLYVNKICVCLSDALCNRQSMDMGKARHLKTFPQATYQKIYFSLDLFLQFYFKIWKLFVLDLKNCDTKYKYLFFNHFFK